MSAEDDWKIPAGLQPKPGDLAFDLDRALESVLSLRATVPPDAFTAETLGTERGGSAVLIDPDGILLTIGYLITEASQVWLTTVDGRAVPGHVLGYDQTTGFGVVQALGRIDVPAMALGTSAKAALVTASSSRPVAGASGPSPPRSSRSRNSPAIGSTSCPTRFSPRRRTRSGAGRR
jgi:hypothetical protein